MMDQFNTTSVIQYEGSLTQPPCSEGVDWNILTKVEPISDYQLEFFTNKWIFSPVGQQGNNRVVQPINDRKIYYKGYGMDGSLGSYETETSLESYETIDNPVESDSSTSNAVTLAASALALIALLSF